MQEALNEMSLSQLVAAYNQRAALVGRDPVKSFRDKATAIKRVQEISSLDVPQQEPVPAAEPEPTVKKKRVVAKRGYRFIFAPQPVSEQRPPREGSRRRILFDLLCREEGTNHAEVMREVNLNERQAYEAIRLIHYIHGFGLRQDERGQVFIRRT